MHASDHAGASAALPALAGMVQAHAAATGLPQLAHLPQSSQVTGHMSQQMAQWAQQPGQLPVNMQPRQFSGQQAPPSMQHQQASQHPMPLQLAPQHEVPQQQPQQAVHSGVSGHAHELLVAQGAGRAATSFGRPVAWLWHKVLLVACLWQGVSCTATCRWSALLG